MRESYIKKPAYVGICILDLSKLLMYEFCYNYIKNKWGTISRLLFTDADSLMYKNKTEDVCEDLKLIKIKKMFDLSNYLHKSKYYDDSNKLVA